MSIADLDRRRLEDYCGQIRQQAKPESRPSDEWRRKTTAWARRENVMHWRSLVDYKMSRSGVRSKKPNGLRSSSTPLSSPTAPDIRRPSLSCCSAAATQAGTCRPQRLMRPPILGRKRTMALGNVARQAGRSSPYMAATAVSRRSGSRSDCQRDRASGVSAVGSSYRAQRLIGSARGRVTRASGERHHAEPACGAGAVAPATRC